MPLSSVGLSVRRGIPTTGPTLVARCAPTLSALRAAGLLALVAAGCGSSGCGDSTHDRAAAAHGRGASFPPASGKSLTDAAPPWPRAGPCSRRACRCSRRAHNRFGFALFDTARKQITERRGRDLHRRNDGGGLRGPVRRALRSRSRSSRSSRARPRATDPDAAKSVYVADVPFDRPGKRDRDRAWPARRPSGGRDPASSGRRPATTTTRPGVGERAPRIHTQTLTDVGGDAAKLDTRGRRADGPARGRLRRRRRQEADRASRSPRRCCARAASAARWSTSSSR